MLLDVVSVVLQDRWARIGTKHCRRGRVCCAGRVDVSAEATRYEEDTPAGACVPHMTPGTQSQRIGSVWKLPLPVDRKHPPQSPRVRIAVVWSATRRPRVRDLPSDRCPLCRWARGGDGYRKRDTPHARGINRRPATLFYIVTKIGPIQGRCDADWNRCASTATSDRTCCSPGTGHTRRGSSPGRRRPRWAPAGVLFGPTRSLPPEMRT